MSEERIHVHDAPDDDPPSGWVVHCAHGTLMGPFETPQAAAAWAGEWLTVPACIVPVLDHARVTEFLHARECERQSRSTQG